MSSSLCGRFVRTSGNTGQFFSAHFPPFKKIECLRMLMKLHNCKKEKGSLRGCCFKLVNNSCVLLFLLLPLPSRFSHPAHYRITSGGKGRGGKRALPGSSLMLGEPTPPSPPLPPCRRRGPGVSLAVVEVWAHTTVASKNML